ncbi:MAG: VCBS repeat-containing protein [Proteobacteria bacterium]|nr:VCBS repeat-containing protein [Pseudomonadota bacterium]
MKLRATLAILALAPSSALAIELPLSSLQTIGSGHSYISSVVAADFDGDGDLDVAGGAHVATSSPSSVQGVYWWENDNGDGSSWTEHLVEGDHAWVRVAAGDLDGDGDIDLASAERFFGPLAGGHQVNVHLNDGDGSSWTSSNIAQPHDVLDVVIRDLDGDGDLDIGTLQSNSGVVEWHENNGGVPPPGLPRASSGSRFRRPPRRTRRTASPSTTSIATATSTSAGPDSTRTRPAGPRTPPGTCPARRARRTSRAPAARSMRSPCTSPTSTGTGIWTPSRAMSSPPTPRSSGGRTTTATRPAGPNTRSRRTPPATSAFAGWRPPTWIATAIST